MDLGLRGRVAIVTGSSRGIGRAIAAALAAEGVRLTLNARGAEPLKAFADELAAGGADVLDVAADVTTPAGCQDVFDRTLERFGQVDILINNVGGGGPTSVGAVDDDWQAALDLNLWPALRLTRLVVPSMQQRRSGAIVMIASIYGREAGGRMGYQMAKSAEISLAKGPRARARARRHSGPERRAWLDHVPRRWLVAPPAGRSAGDGRVCAAGHAAGTLRTARGGG